MRYNFDISKYTTDQLPGILRKPRQMAWIRVLLEPFRVLHSRFLNFVFWSSKETNKSGTVIVLKKILVDHATQNGIAETLAEANIFVEDYPYDIALPEAILIAEALATAEIIPARLLTEGVSMSSALTSELESPYSFQVRVTNDTVFQALNGEPAIRANIDKYRTFGRTFNIKHT